jgi:hypothetical protein
MIAPKINPSQALTPACVERKTLLGEIARFVCRVLDRPAPALSLSSLAKAGPGSASQNPTINRLIHAHVHRLRESMRIANRRASRPFSRRRLDAQHPLVLGVVAEQPRATRAGHHV